MEAAQIPARPIAEAEVRMGLADLAKDMPRREVMKKVVGPALTALLQPIYEPSFTAEEMNQIPGDTTFPDVSRLVGSMGVIAIDRLDQRLDNEFGRYASLEALRHAREELFFDFSQIFVGADFKTNLQDSIESTMQIPIVVAVDILRLESDEQSDSETTILDEPVDPQALIDIMRRPSFDRILSRLAKGPNDFITAYRSDPKTAFTLWDSSEKDKRRMANAFFGFRKGFGEYKERARLTIWDAYRLEGGQVVDLSYQYFQSAKAQRQEIERRGAMVFSRGKHRGENSSGCPVRHTFEDFSESLILTNKNFIIAALEIAERKKVQSEVAQLIIELEEITNPEPSQPLSRAQRVGNWLMRRTQTEHDSVTLKAPSTSTRGSEFLDY